MGASDEGLSSSYSNWGASLAGLIVANVSGLSFEDYVETNILRPLSMRSSTFKEPLPEELQKHMSVGYTFEAGAFKPQGYEQTKAQKQGCFNIQFHDLPPRCRRFR